MANILGLMGQSTSTHPKILALKERAAQRKELDEQEQHLRIYDYLMRGFEVPDYHCNSSITDAGDKVGSNDLHLTKSNIKKFAVVKILDIDNMASPPEGEDDSFFYLADYPVTFYFLSDRDQKVKYQKYISTAHPCSSDINPNTFALVELSTDEKGNTWWHVPTELTESQAVIVHERIKHLLRICN